ncbi:MAG: hypothetical protein R2854_19595 [Caldilineaceae bacterium]
MNILVINSGSSSIKYKLFAMPAADVRCTGLVERIGEAQGRIKHGLSGRRPSHPRVEERAIPDHAAGLQRVAALLAAA